MNTARILECTTAEYLADPLPTPSLSSSAAHTLIHRSPLHCWLEHPRLGGRPRTSTKDMDTGSLVHALLLEAGKGIVKIDADDWRTKAAKEARDQARAEGKVPVLERELAAAARAVNAIRERLVEFDIDLTDGRNELAVTWEEPFSGAVPCRAMLDHVQLTEGRIVDVKTIGSADPHTCAKHVLDYGYAIQRAAYTRAIGQLHPELAGRVDFVFVFCEVAPPYAVTPARLDGGMREIGETQWERAVALWSRCLRAGVWPAYANQIIQLEAPPWALSRELGEAV